ncbi:hypothetical protein BABINDRAFT_40280 [Babjeviella inositovora NRRL Y-12698]|uniref:Inorganic phosphate transport PHO88 n=1 Tax=Babjeviella inositovora NRRL Y-12698 TaxID=984486 RepID=A0A1E3QM17_9ASCO|nr:uncharacterized protein BABINDRAFT_40280 [Babjeviella inositovora NRRL Y-12698]ODQ78027.1 hypothetical protein BABINDRAFT_40280 [Babjeviella inositovora NRRL Y-12698]
MNPAFTNLGVMLVMMQVSKKMDWENPSTVFYVRILYSVCTLFCLAVYLYVRQQIISKNDLTTMKYVEPASPFGGSSEEKLIVTTVKDYDLKQIQSSIKGVFTGLAMMGFMHLYMKYTNPLLMQSISPVKSALESQIVKIHLFGKPAIGDLKRPFAAASMFGAAAPAKTDKHTIETAEVSGNGGVKEE